ncbi:D-2-hydroxyacid dehydrogenase [Propionibacterium sp.]|uniref:D-2-hydroxyacid dehydrogenase n=1 Tax=Propionibacterium sp. TaxID=1977903 RepID=UPI0039E7F46B
MSEDKKLRIAVAAPLHDDSVALIEEREPRVEVVKDDSLIAPMRWAADFSGDPAFHRTEAQDVELRALLDSADVLFGKPDAASGGITRAVRDNPKLRWVQLPAAGGGGQVKGAHLTREELDRVVFTTGSGPHAGPLAEFAIFGILAGFKDLARLQAQQRDKLWTGRWEMREMDESTVLVLGLGHIGREVAAKLHALGARVIGTSRHTDLQLPNVDEIVSPAELVSVVGRVDAIVNTLPGTDATKNLVSAEVLAAVKPGATITSVGRGTVIDETALVEALKDGRIGQAVLDVFATEPLPQNSPLWTLPNVVVSPHTAANSPKEERLIAELFADNATRFLDGKPLRNVVNTVEFY